MTLNWMIFRLFYKTFTLFLLCVILTLKEILTVTLILMMHDVYVYAPLIYYVLFYLSLCAFYEKTKNVNLMILRLTLIMILKLTLILTLNVCMIFHVVFLHNFRVRFSRVALDWP